MTTMMCDLTDDEHRRFDELRAKMAPAFQAIVDIEASRRGLTWKERQVLNLVLDGMANQKLAAAAFITDKTAKHHVSSIFRKFGVSSRSQLSASLFRRAPAAD